MREYTPACSNRDVCASCDGAALRRGNKAERQEVKQNCPDNGLKLDLKEALQIELTSRWILSATKDF
jgi:hypothetical protein